MKRLISAILVFLLMVSSVAFCEEEDISVEHVQAVAMGEDNTADSDSEGEDAGEYLESHGIEQKGFDAGSAELTFEEGFVLTVPSDWVYYSISDQMAESGVVYALSDPSGKCQLYIQFWTTDCANVEELATIIQNTSSPASSGIHEFSGTPFVVYDLPADDVSCAAALIGGKVMNLVFTPQSDTEYMLTAAAIMQSFCPAQ